MVKCKKKVNVQIKRREKKDRHAKVGGEMAEMEKQLRNGSVRKNEIKESGKEQGVKYKKKNKKGEEEERREETSC